MSRGVWLKSRPVVVALTSGGLVVALGALQFLGNLVDFSDEPETRFPLSVQQRSLSVQLEGLRADDGLFTASLGAAARPGLYESAHALTALHAVTGRRVDIDGVSTSLRAEFVQPLKIDPLASSIQIAAIERATGKVLHTHADEKALRDSLSAEGYFQGDSSEQEDVSSRLANTSGALAAISQFGVSLDEKERSVVRDWLQLAARDAPRQPVQLYHLAYIADELDAPPPPRLAEQSQSWWREHGVKLSAPGNDEDVIEVSYYILLADRLALDLTNQRAQLCDLLAPEMRSASADPQTTSLIARAWTKLQAPSSELDGITAGIRSRQLPSGLVSSVQQRQGSLTSTYEVSRLRMVAGLENTDSQLRQALENLKATALAKYDPLLRGAWLVLMESVGGDVSSQERTSVISAAKEATPRSVTVNNVELWNRYTEIFALLDEELPTPTVIGWKANGPQRRYARSLLINGLDRSGHTGSLPAAPQPETLVADAEERLKAGTVREAAEALDAASALGWVPDVEDARRITALLEKRRTCPGASAFYRDSAGDTECGVPGTRAAYRISALLEGALPADRATAPTS